MSKKTDYCGCAGDGFLPRLISKLIPDVVFGVDISECCKNHDLSWENRGANKSGDIAFRMEIEDKFYIAGKPAWQGFLVAWWYFIGVRLGGIVYKLQGK